ncbi:hypothetical protein [Tellurirhabdus bombi]|uniref:hypothetical protein n=1 Tax=Tellurirhabdus bombi TaxID=2907205 RepID=UPI001F2A8BD1|nr:hypothetical protein [Tellurirhabdus bombi]
MSDRLFDIKNDRRLSVYLYRAGFGFWLLYILMGARFLQELQTYRSDCGVFSFFLMVMALSTSMYYDYHHHPSDFEQKKKWLVAGYLVLGGLVYFFILGNKIPSLAHVLP